MVLSYTSSNVRRCSIYATETTIQQSQNEVDFSKHRLLYSLQQLAKPLLYSQHCHIKNLCYKFIFFSENTTNSHKLTTTNISISHIILKKSAYWNFPFKLLRIYLYLWDINCRIFRPHEFKCTTTCQIYRDICRL